ncbi:MAG: pitrilysin family protein [Rhodopila sp.]|nr:pitrilysin family protein [Rhodopila sp.]
MDIRLTTLPSGLRIVTANLPGFDSAAVAAFVDSGSRNETEGENGIAHFLEHMAFKGTTSRTALDIAREVENLGSNMNAFTSQSMTAYFVTGLAPTIEKSVAIIGDVLTASVFDEAEIATEKGVILQEISRSFDNPGNLAYNGFGSIAYPDQALGRSILGPPDMIRAMTRDHFASFVDRFYVARNIVVVGAGAIEHTAFAQMVEKYFAGLPNRPSVPDEAPARWVGGYNRAGSNKFEQVTALIGWNSVPETDERVHAHSLLATAIGGGMSSPLFQEVREKRGLVYSVSGSHDSGVDFGEMLLYAGTTPDKLDEVIKVSCGVFRDAMLAIGPEDLARAKNRELVALATIKERPFGLARFLASGLFDHGRIVAPDERKRAVEAVTTDDVIEAATMIFKTNPAIALVGPVPDTDYVGLIKAEMGAA